jgi:radical SAM protein with 4Fe4S-binding SPASM domain
MQKIYKNAFVLLDVTRHKKITMKNRIVNSKGSIEKIRNERIKANIINKWYYTPLSLRYFGWLFKFYSASLKSLLIDSQIFLNYYILGRKPDLGNGYSDTLIVVPTNACNAKCVFCANRLLTDSCRIMDFKIYKCAVDEFKRYDGHIISLTPTVGDALIDKDIFRKVAYAKKKGFYVLFYTNALLLKNNILPLLDANVDELLISLGDIDYKVEAKIYGIPEKLAKSKIEGILDLLKEMMRQKSKMVLTLGFRASRSFSRIWYDILSSEFKKYYDLGLFRIEYLFSYDNWGGRIRGDDLLGVQKLKRAIKLKKYPCTGLYVLSILPDGSIRLCGCRVKDTLYDDLIIGNVHTDNLTDIFYSKKRKDILRDFIHGKYPNVCKDCSFYCPKY